MKHFERQVSISEKSFERGCLLLNFHSIGIGHGNQKSSAKKPVRSSLHVIKFSCCSTYACGNVENYFAIFAMSVFFLRLILKCTFQSKHITFVVESKIWKLFFCFRQQMTRISATILEFRLQTPVK